jgi:hypothetical protein
MALADESQWSVPLPSNQPLQRTIPPQGHAAKKGLVLSTLKFWKRVLRNDVESRTKSALPAFLPVSVLHAARTPSSDAAVLVEIDLANGRRLRMHVKPDTDFTRVSDLVNAVEGGHPC